MNTSTMIHRLEQSSESTGKYRWTINKNTKNNTAKRHRTEDYNILQGSIQRLKQLKIRYQCGSMAQQYVTVSYGSGFYDIEAPPLPPNQEEEHHQQDKHEQQEADEENQLQIIKAKERKNVGKQHRRFEKYSILQAKIQKFKKANQCEEMGWKTFKADYVIDINP